MRGSQSDPGMMILCVKDILDWVDSHPKQIFVLRVAYMEVYNEEINDLLGDGTPASKKLAILSEDAAKGCTIQNLQEKVVTSAEMFMAVLAMGENSRSYASTSMNENSSRSHTIYRVAIEVRDKDEGAEPGLDENGFMRKASTDSE